MDELAPEVDALDGIDEKYHGLYAAKEDGSGFTLGVKVKGTVPEATVVNLRTNRDEILNEKKKVQQELETFRTRFDGVDPEEYARLKTSGNLDERVKTEVEERVGSLKTEWDQEREELVGTINGLKHEISLSGLESSVRDVVLKEGSPAKPEALRHIIREAKDTWGVTDDGKQVPLKDGKPMYSKQDPTQFMGAEEWVATLVENEPLFQRQPKGGGAGGKDDVPVNGSGFKPRSKMNNQEKLAAIKKLGRAGYLKLPE